MTSRSPSPLRGTLRIVNGRRGRCGRAKDQWKAVFENNPTMYFMVGSSGDILSVNPFGAEQLGFTVAELIGLPVRELFHEGDREAVEK